MTFTKPKEFTGYSDIGLEEAIAHALSKAEDYSRIEVIETRSSLQNDEQRHYQVTLAAHDA